MTSTSPFPATLSILSAAHLLRYVSDNYDIVGALECRFLHLGLNDTYEVLTTSDRFILRVYRAGWRTLESIRYEVEVLSHLAARGLAVSAPIVTKTGERLQELMAAEGPRYAALFAAAPGTHPASDVASAALYGKAAAAIHRDSDDFRSAFDRPVLDLSCLLDGPVRSILPFLKDRPNDRDYLEALSERLRAGIRALPAEELEYGFCHGDFHGGNAHIDGENRLTFFDFDCCGPGWRAYDVAVYRWNSRLRGNEAALWEAFLRGYTEVRSIPHLDLDATKWFVAIRHIWWLGLLASVTPTFGFATITSEFIDKQVAFLRACELEYFQV